MASPLAVYKLTILYMLDRINGPIAMSRITEFLLENGYVNFVSLNQTLAEIEESGLVRSETRRDGIFLYITQEGTETLNFFSGSLSDEIKGQVDEYRNFAMTIIWPRTMTGLFREPGWSICLSGKRMRPS